MRHRRVVKYVKQNYSSRGKKIFSIVDYIACEGLFCFSNTSATKQQHFSKKKNTSTPIQQHFNTNSATLQHQFNNTSATLQQHLSETSATFQQHFSKNSYPGSAS